MHFNIYIDDQIGAELNKAAKKSGKSRNALIREAIAEWLCKSAKSKWPPEILAFRGIANSIEFENHRQQMEPPTEDPLA